MGFDAKVARAKEHLGALKASVDAFVTDRDAYSVIKKVDAKAGVYIFSLKLHREPLLIEWSLALGDCIHNMRSALDHLFWALILLKNPGGIGDSTVSFPILRDKTTFNGRKAKLEKWVGKDVLAMIENMQPYQGAGPDKNGLLFIHLCDITDKHKLLVPLVGIAKHGQITAEGRYGNFIPEIHTELPHVPMEDGAVVAKITVTPAESIVNVDLNPTLGIVLKPGGLRADITVPGLEGLVEILEWVRADFAPLFPGHTSAP